MFLLDFACTRFIENMEKSLDITAFSLSLLIGNICTGSISSGQPHHVRMIGVADGFELHTGADEPLQLGKAFERDRLSLLF